MFTELLLHLCMTLVFYQIHAFNICYVASWIVLFNLVDGPTCAVGMYVMVIGAYIATGCKDNYPAIKVRSHFLISVPAFLHVA